MTDISNHDDIIDSRDVIARIEELEAELAERHEAGQFASSFDDWIANSRDNSNPIYAAFPDDGHDVQCDIEELYKLRALAEQASGYAADWQHGETLVRDSYFETYAQELAEDIGAVDRNASWPNTCIDWEQAARELQMDYTSVDFDGVTYWIR